MSHSRVINALVVDSVLNSGEAVDSLGFHETNSRIKNFQLLSKTPSLDKNGDVEFEHDHPDSESSRQEDEDHLDEMLFSENEED